MEAMYNLFVGDPNDDFNKRTGVSQGQRRILKHD
jgi:hypothetical protein